MAPDLPGTGGSPAGRQPRRAEAARGHWRRQLVLTGVAAATAGLALSLVAVSAALGPDAPRYVRSATGIEVATSPTPVWPAVAGAVALTAALGAVIHHAVRVAAYTFRRGGDE